MQLQAAIFLAAANERLIEYLFTPVKRHWPEHDFWYIPYVVFVSGFALGYLAQIGLYQDAIDNTLLDRLLSAATIACGSEFLHKTLGALRRE